MGRRQKWKGQGQVGRSETKAGRLEHGEGEMPRGRGTVGRQGTAVGWEAAERWEQRAKTIEGTGREPHLPYPHYGSVGQGVFPASTCCLRRFPRNVTSCQTCTTRFLSQFHSDPGPDLRGISKRPVNWAHYVSSPPTLPQSSFPTSQQTQQLNNGAVWLQTLRLHRAELEAPTQHSCP